MASYILLLQFTDSGARNVQDSPKRAAVACVMAKTIGVKIKEVLWTLGFYDIVLLAEAPNDETVTAFALRLSSLGNVRTQTLRTFSRKEFERILAKMP